jgi:hypothetical protein
VLGGWVMWGHGSQCLALPLNTRNCSALLCDELGAEYLQMG